MALDSMKEIFERLARENIPFWEIVLQYDMEERQVSRQASMAKMLSTWQAIQDAADSYTGTQRSVSGRRRRAQDAPVRAPRREHRR